jgi:transposase
MAPHLLSFLIPVLWLKPEVEIVSRDRGGDYAAAARKGAPQAQQVADKFHLLKNLGSDSRKG